MATSSEAFDGWKSLIRIHLKEILRLDEITENVPMQSVALLVVVAYEALARFLHPRERAWYLFTREHLTRYDVPLGIGTAIFGALRNGLAHRYGAYPIVVDGLGEVRLQLAWKDGAPYHFRGISVTKPAIHQIFTPFPSGSTEVPRNLCINVESLRDDLVAALNHYEGRLTADPALAGRFDHNVQKNHDAFTRAAIGSAACQWRDFLTSRRAELSSESRESG